MEKEKGRGELLDDVIMRIEEEEVKKWGENRKMEKM